ncbi:MAG: co-chaperone GroES [Bacteroidales bacterium]
MISERLKNIIVVGDRVLIKLKTAKATTRGGLVLPPGYSEKEEIQTGYVIKTGPGYPIPSPRESDGEPWKKHEEQPMYIPLQARPGDLAVFMQKGAVEVVIDGEKYFVVSHHSILLLERDEELFD